LYKPETISEVIAKQNWSLGRKANVVYSYSLFIKWLGITWGPLRIKIPEKLPFIPAREELNYLIAGLYKTCGFSPSNNYGNRRPCWRNLSPQMDRHRPSKWNYYYNA